MGNPLYSDNVGGMCYNPAKSFQIASAGAWYEDSIITWNSGSTTPKLWSGKVVGVADYDNNPLKHPVSIKLETGTSTDYFLGFNRAKGVNRDNQQASDQVTIIETGSNGVGYSQSFLKATLSQGQSYTFSNWQGSGKDMVVTIKTIDLNADPGFADVSLNFNNAPETPAPTPMPTVKITPAPVALCGDGVCMPNESDVNCPIDCVDAELATFSDNIGARVANGTMFVVKALRDVAITSISTYTYILSTGEAL